MLMSSSSIRLIKKAVSLLPLALCCFSASARQMSASEAYLVGESVLGDKLPATMNNVMSSRSNRSVAPVVTLREGNINTIYAFNRPTGGYMIVSADDQAETPVLGWSDNGQMPSMDEMPDNMKWWLECMSDQAASNAAAQMTPDMRRTSSTPIYAAVAPLMTTKWGQLAPYNDMTPVIEGTHTPAGCVAVAVAQVMNYHRFPVTGTGSKSYVSKGQRLSVDFSAVTFEWDKMVNSFSGSTDAEANEAVAKLLYSVGVGCKTTYTPSASSASATNAALTLLNNFGYDPGMRILNREYFKYDAWMDILYNELKAGRPVIYTGSNPEGGHAFVADGYYLQDNTDYVHINWGWDGYSNGYFAITAMNPVVQGVGGSTSGYNNAQTMIVGIQPAREDSYAQPVPEFTGDFSISTKSVNVTADATVRVSDPSGIFMVNLSKASARFGVRLENEAGEVKFIPCLRDRQLVRGSAVLYYDMEASDFPTEGVWTVSPAVQDVAGNWTYTGMVKMNKVRKCTLVASDNELTFTDNSVSEASATPLTLLSPVFSGRTFGVGAYLSTSSNEYFRQVAPVLFKDGVRVATGPMISVQLYPGEAQYIEWVGKFASSFEPGQYTMCLVQANGTVINDPVEVTVEATPQEEAEIELAVEFDGHDMEMMTGSGKAAAHEVSISPLTVTVYIECKSGYYCENIAGVIFEGNQGRVKLPEQFVGVKAGETVALTFEYEGEELNHDTTYNLKTLASNSQTYIGNPVYFRSSLATIADIDSDNTDTEFVKYYTLDGTQVAAPSTSGIYVAIDAQGNAHKIAIR